MANRPIYLYRWRDDEIALIEKHAECLPFSEILQRLNRMNSRKGYATRSDKALYAQLGKMGYSAIPSLSRISPASLARALGVSTTRVNRWKRLIPAYRAGVRKFVFDLEDVRSLARREPRYFAGIERDRLEWLLENDTATIERCLSEVRRANQYSRSYSA